MGNQTGAAGLGTLGEEISTKHALSPQEVKAGTVDGATIDRRGFNVMVLAAVVAAAAGNVATKIQESDTGTGGWTDAAAGEFGGVTLAVAPADANTTKELEVDLRGMKRYVRTTNVGDASGAILGQAAVLSGVDVEAV